MSTTETRIEWAVRRPGGFILEYIPGMTPSEAKEWTEETARAHCNVLNKRDGGGWQAISRTTTIITGDWQ